MGEEPKKFTGKLIIDRIRREQRKATQELFKDVENDIRDIFNERKIEKRIRKMKARKGFGKKYF